MSHTLSRRELYDLAWSEPIKDLAQRFELSDSGLAKACKRADIPRPPRGYWAKLKARKRVFRQPLPARGPGMSDQVEVGRRRGWGYHGISEEEILASNPEQPVFEDEIADVAERVKTMVGHVAVPKTLAKAHRQIGRLLEADEVRRQEQLKSRYPSSWNAPIFDDPFEKRRLRVLNAIFVALERIGMKPSLRGREARELGVKVNDQNVSFTLDHPSQKYDRYRGASIGTRGSSNKLKLAIPSWGRSSESQKSWEDADGFPLEKCLREIVAELIVSGERNYRDGRQSHYEWLVERKAQIIEEAHKQKEEAERRERERLIQLEKARVDRLSSDAMAYRQAIDIRTYVGTVRANCAQGNNPVSADALGAWTRWALAQADRIDPVHSGRFLESMQDPEESDEIEYC